MYDNDSSVTITGVQGDKDNSILSVTATVSGTGVLSGTPYTVSNGTASGNGSGEIFDITLDTTTNISNITINNPVLTLQLEKLLQSDKMQLVVLVQVLLQH